MIRSAVTVSLVEEARGGPFVFWDGLPAAFKRAAEIGFDAVEIFAPGPDAVDRKELNSLVEQYQLPVAAVGTGAGMVKHGLNLTDPDPKKRTAARGFIKEMIDFGGAFGAPAIIGSMQGKWGGDIDRDAALALLTESLNELGQYAEQHNTTLIYEPLNRYETNLITTIADGVQYLQSLEGKNVRLLADLFHMNIEEASLPDAIRAGAGLIGHVHFVDSNRQAAGFGHMDYGPIVQALKESNYDGYLSAEAFPMPDSDAAAEKTMKTFKKCFTT